MDENSSSIIKTPNENKSISVEIERTLNIENKIELASTEQETIMIGKDSSFEYSNEGIPIIIEDQAKVIKINNKASGDNIKEVDAEKENITSKIIVEDITDLDKDAKDDLNPDTTYWVYFHFAKLNSFYRRRHTKNCRSEFCYSPRRPFFLALTLTVLTGMYFLTYSLIKYLVSMREQRIKYANKPQLHLIFSGVTLFITYALMIEWAWARLFPINLLFCIIAVWALGSAATVLVLQYDLTFITPVYNAMTLIMVGCIIMALATLNFRGPTAIMFIGIWSMVVGYYTINDYRIVVSLTNKEFLRFFLALFTIMCAWLLALQMMLVNRESSISSGCPWDFFAVAFVLYLSIIQIAIFAVSFVLDLFFADI